MFLVKPDVRFPCSVFICLRVYATCADICFVVYIWWMFFYFKKRNKQKQRGMNMFMQWMSHNLVCCMPQSGWSGWETFIPTCLFDPPCLTSFVPPLKWKVPDEAKMFFTMFRCFSFQWNVRLWPLWNAFDAKCMNGKEGNTWKGRWTKCSVWKLNLEPQFADGQKRFERDQWRRSFMSVLWFDVFQFVSCACFVFKFYFVWRPTLRG